MGKENLAIKLKENYILLVHPRTGKDMIVFDQEKEQIIIKLNIERILKQYPVDFYHLDQHFTTSFTLSKTLEGQLLLKIYSLYPDLFVVKSLEDEQVKEDFISLDFAQTIKYEDLFTTYSPEENKIEGPCILWGINEVNDRLMQSLSSIGVPLILMKASRDQLKDIQCVRFLTSKNYREIDDYYKEVQNLYGLQILDSTSLKEEKKKLSQGIHIIDNRLLEYDLMTAEDQEIIQRGIKLHYGFYVEKFIAGPLVVNEANYGYASFKQVFHSHFSLASTSQSLILAGLLNRTLYYILKKTLKYLAEDAQLPMNQVFAFDNYSLTSEVIDLEVENEQKGEKV